MRIQHIIKAVVVNLILLNTHQLSVFVFTALPEIQRHEITEDWEFVILACDGIWDVMSSEEVINFIRKRFADAAAELEEKESPPVDPEEVCEQLISACLAPDALMGTGCDNMTVVLVCFLHGKPYSQMLVHCREPPAKQKPAEE